MAEIKNTFTSGKMNKDLDERLVGDGEYKDALNIDVAFSESSDVGSAQNSYGNVKKSLILPQIAGAKCIGSLVDKQKETLIWFISGTSIDAIAEYNVFTGDVTPILVDTNKSNSNSFLNFSNSNLITGSNVLDDFLFFTDNNSEPKKINISRMKNGCTNFSTTTKYQNSDGTYTNSVYEDLITVIKKYPLQAPKIKLDSSIRPGNVKGIARTLSKTSYVDRIRATEAGLLSNEFITQNVFANTAGSSTIYNLTEDQYIERAVDRFTDDNGVSVISFATTGFIDGDAYKKWRAVEPGMKIAISGNGSGSFTEPSNYHTITTVDWLNHTVSVVHGSLTSPPANSTKVRLMHWSEPHNNDYFWAYKDNNGTVVKKPIGTSSKNNLDQNGNVIKDGGVLADGSGVDVFLTASDATSGSNVFQYGTGWSFNSSTKTYSYDGSGGGTERYPKITKPTDLLVGHIYRMDFTIVISSSGVIGFLNNNSNHGSGGASSGIQGLETVRRSTGTHKCSIVWKQKLTGDNGMLCLYSGGGTVGSVKIDEITCISKARPVKIQPIQFYGNTTYEVNDIIRLKAEDSSAINPEDDQHVDISVRLLEKIQAQNTKKISNTHALAIGTGVVGNDKVSNGNFSDLTTWHTGTSGTTDVGTSSAGFYVTGGALTSSDSQSGYIRNVLAEALVAGETYKLTYTVTTAQSGSSGSKGYLKLILATNDRYNLDDKDFGHSNHILLPTTSTYTHSVYFTQKSLDRQALSLTELMFYNDGDWDGAIDNIILKKVSGNSTVNCGTIGTQSGKQAFDVEIVSIDDSVVYNLDKLKFASTRVQSDAIYEKEFARFSYRWKYLDNEYSAISPFTEVAFIPKNEEGYKYDPKDGYNKSMVNDLRRITLSGISSMPEDVKSLDVLYKKSNSTNVYILRTVEHDDFDKLKIKDSIVITSEEIKSLLPENQMLRPYDNVPRRALAQEITANRLIYGNYTQQYNYFNTPASFRVKINSNEISTKPLKSLKSIRDYQVGVVFLDNYGRQTPVFTNETGIIKLDQSKSKTANSIQCSLTSKSPEWATHYKYYIKDSANEFYNLAMDRFYSDVEDENVWLSFPSSEINKVNENDYIALKKEHDTELAVTVEGGSTVKYKILDKQANPPEHIKFKMAEVGESSDNVTFSATNIVASSDNNAAKNAKYENQVERFPSKGSSQFLISSYDLREDAEFLDEIDSYITNTGVWYDLDNRFFEIRSKLNGTISEKYELTHIYKKSITTKIPVSSVGTTEQAQGVVGNKSCILVKANGTASKATTINLLTNEKTSKSVEQVVNNPDEHIEVGMRLVQSERSLDYQGAVVVVTAVSSNSVTLSASVAYSDKQEIYFKDVTDAFYFKTKKPFGFDIGFLGSSPVVAKRELLDIASASYNASSTKLPNPQDLKLSVKFYKQTTEDFGEEFKGKFFIKIKRDSFLNNFIYKSQAAIHTFKSRDSANLFYAKSWLLNQGDSDAIIVDTDKTNSSDYIKEILQIPSNPDYRFGHAVTSLAGARRAFGAEDGSNTRLVSGSVNGNGFNLNPETAGGVAYAATAAIAGSNVRLKIGGTTRGILSSSVYGQNSINGYNMKELDYATPANSGGATNPSICIDQSISFRLQEKNNSKQENADGVKPLYSVAPYVGDGWQIGRTNISFKLFGINGYGTAKSNLGDLYNFYRYLTTPGQNFRFTQDPTRTVYTIRKADSFLLANTDARDKDGDIVAGNSLSDTRYFKYYEKAIGLNIQLDKAIVWSPLEQTGAQSQDLLNCLALNTNSYAAGKTFSSAETKLNKENVSSLNSRTFSACEIDFGDAAISSETPAVFEVLPKEKVDLNLFYETPSTRMIVKDGMSVKTEYRTVNGENPLLSTAVLNTVNKNDSKVFQVKGAHVLHTIPAGETLIVYKEDVNNNIVYSQKIILESDIVRETIQGLTSQSNISLDDGFLLNVIDPNLETLEYYNCFSFGNGVESNRLFDDYNAVTIDKGPRVSTILDTDYQEEEKFNGLIYSGIYNSKSSFNSLNQFIQGEKITKDLNPDYGSIQKLFTRNTNIVAICEDKVLKVLANKDALFNADGNTQLTSTNAVLGQTIPFAGEYGMSKNPESFASYGYRCYFTDKKRGAVLRLSGDGLTNIADKGMSKFFRDNLDNSLVILGSYDSLKNNYNVTLNEKTVSFTEKVNGWVSRKSFLPENGLCYSNSYYTFKLGEIWMHGESLTRNNFYGDQYSSTITTIFNNEPSSVKSFKTIGYEGTSGWIASKITTDKESGSVSSFIEKEGKYYNFIKGSLINNDVDLLKTAGLNVQGIGHPTGFDLNGNVRSFTHTVTAVDLASNVQPVKWIINNSTDPTVTSKVIKFNEKTGTSVSKTVDFYIHPQTVKGIKWKISADDFTYTLSETISNFSGSVAGTLHANGYIKVRITYSSNSFHSSNKTSTLTIAGGSAYQEQI